jgi:hypothetical protein
MQQYALLVLGNAVDGQDAEFNSWYDEHVAEIIQLPGFVSATRFRYLEPGSAGVPCPCRYLTVYEIADGKFETARDAMAQLQVDRRVAIEEGRLPPAPLSDAMDPTGVQNWWFTQVGGASLG